MFEHDMFDKTISFRSHAIVNLIDLISQNGDPSTYVRYYYKLHVNSRKVT